MNRIFIAGLIALFIGMMAVGCVDAEVAAESPSSDNIAKKETTQETKDANQAVARIVFIDKENCCQCTQDRIDASWAALQAALAGRASPVPVERVHVDTQPELAAQYRNKQAFMALPAVYLLDGSGNVVELLQGELTHAQVSAALEKP